MSEGSVQISAARRQRIQRLKKCIVGMLAAGTALSFCLCIVLLVQICRIGGRLNSLVKQTETLTELLETQQEQLDELWAEKSVMGQGNTAVSESGRELQAQSQGIVTDKGEEREEGAESGEEAEELVPAAAHRVYLTFDDGPSAYTDDILDILDQYDVKATFFVVGKESESAKAALQDIVARGHTLGMHSYSHKYSEVYRSVEDFAEDFTRLRDYLYEVTGAMSNVYRFPGGSSNTVSRIDMHEFASYLTEQEVVFFDWNISSGDGGKELLSADALVENCTADIEKHGSSVILMHDSANKRTTVEALPAIIEAILAMEDTEILPITEDTEPVQHIH